MAEDQDKLSSDTSGAGTKAHKPSKAEQAKLPGGADFDFENASPEDFAKHEEILRRRASMATLTPATAAPVSAGQGYSPAPDDIRATKDGQVRYFTPLTWEAMETKGKHDGWEVAVNKPKDL